MTVVRKLTTVWGFKTDNAKVIAFAKSVDRAKRNVDGVSRALGKVGDQVKRAGKVLLGFGAAVTAGVVIPALKVEDSLKNTMTMVTATGAEFDRLEVGMRKFGFAMSNELGMSAAKVNKGFYQVLSTGAEALSKDFTELATTAMKMGKVVELEPAVAVEKLADSVNAFGLPMTKAREVADKFFRTTQLASTDLPQLTMALRDAAPAAAGLKIPMNDMLAILGGFAAGGIKGSQAGNAFKMVLNRLAAPVDEAAKWMKKLEVNTFDLETKAMRPMIDVLTDYVVALERLNDEQKATAIKAIFGEESMSKFLGLMNRNMGVLKTWSKEIGNAGDAIETAFKIKMSSGWQQILKTKHEIINTAAAIGLDLIPTIKEAGEKFRDWMKDNQKAIAEYGKTFTTSIKDSIGWVEQHREKLVQAAKVLAIMWGTSKLVEFGIAIKALAIAVGLVGTAFVAVGAGALYAMNKINDLLRETIKFFGYAEKQDYLAGVKKVLIQRERQATLNLEKRLEEGASKKEIDNLRERLNRTRQKLGMALSLGPKTVTPKEKPVVGRRPGAAFGGTSDNEGGGGAAGGGKSILDDIFQPGFGEGVAANFRDFLMQRFQGGQPTLAGQERPLDLRSLSSLLSKQSGAQTTKYERNVSYYISGSRKDGEEIVDKIEQRERRWAMDFAMFPISAVKIPGGG